MMAEYDRVMTDFDKPTLAREGIDGCYDKMIVRGSGIDMPLKLLSPYQCFDLEVYEAVMETMRSLYPDWN